MSAKRSPLGDFGKLPAELRNEIYLYALTTKAPIKIARENYSALACFRPGRCPVHKFDGMWREPKGNNGIEVWSGKEKRTLPPGQVLAVNLLCTSKAINQEATPMFYGLNHFDFATAEAVKRMMPGMHNKAALLANVSFPVTGDKKTDKGLRLMNRMAKPRNVVARKVECAGMNYAGSSVEEAWDGIKQIVRTQTLFDPPGLPDWNFVWVDLPLEVQLERFSAFRFDVKAELKFDVTIDDDEDDGDDEDKDDEAAADLGDDGTVNGTEETPILDGEERQKEYKSLVKEIVCREAAEAADRKEAQEKALSELMRARKADGRV